MKKEIKNIEIKDINLQSSISDINNNELSFKGIFNLNNSEYENISVESEFNKKVKKIYY